MPTKDQAQEWYDPADPVHGFEHVERVRTMAMALAREEGADVRIVEAAAWLHDVSGAAPAAADQPDQRSQHERRSAEFARQVLESEGWLEQDIEAVVDCVLSHRYRSSQEPESLEAKVLFDADKLDVIGAFGVARTLGYAFQKGQPAYAPVSEKFEQSGQLEPGEPHSAYHEYRFKLRHVYDRLHTPAARRIGRQRRQLLASFFDQLKAEAEAGL
jgi:uncharacterized protein